MNLLHKTEELSRFENELFLLYSIDYNSKKFQKYLYIYIVLKNVSDTILVYNLWAPSNSCSSYLNTKYSMSRLNILIVYNAPLACRSTEAKSKPRNLAKE
jgi:hypothetical protein